MPIMNTALLSFGMSGRLFHAPFIELHPGFKRTACWERSTKRINELYPSVESYDSLEDLLADESIDLVVVNTPTMTHYEFAKKVLESGKHTVVEKAFVGNADEATELRDLAQAKGRKLAVFQNRRWDSDFQSVRNVLEQGVLGDIVEANFAYSRFDPDLSPKAHKEEPSSGSGVIMDLGSHVIDQVLLLFGMPESVFADMGITRANSRVIDYMDILLRYEDKRVHVKGGYFYMQPLPEFTLFGTKGCFLKRRTDPQEPQLDAGLTPADSEYGVEPDGSEGQLYTGGKEQSTMSLLKAPRGNYMAFYDGLHPAICEDRVEPVTADEGVRVMQIIDAARQSQRDGTVVRL